MRAVAVFVVLVVVGCDVAEAARRRNPWPFDFFGWHQAQRPAAAGTRRTRRERAQVDCKAIREGVAELTAERLAESLRKTSKTQRAIIEKCLQETY